MQDREALYQSLKRLLPLHPRQGRPQTVMDTRPKGDMQVGVPGDVKLLRRGELLWVTIGRGDEPPGTVERPDTLAAQLEVLDGEALQRLDGGIVAQAFLRGTHRQRWIALQQSPLLRMVDEGQRPIADEVDRRLMACQEQEHGIRQDLIARINTALLTTGDYGQQVIARSGQPFLDERREILHQSTDGFPGRPHTIGLPTADKDELFRQLPEELAVLVGHPQHLGDY